MIKTYHYLEVRRKRVIKFQDVLSVARVYLDTIRMSLIPTIYVLRAQFNLMHG